MNVKRLGLMSVLTLLMGLSALFAGVVVAGDTLKTVDQGEIPLLGPTWDHTTVAWSLKVSGGAPDGASAAVTAAMADWAHETSAASAGAPGGPFVLLNVPVGTGEDISIQVLGGGGKIAGSARRDLDANGFFEHVDLKISGKSFGRENPADVIKSIVLHEVGHGVGAGHATSDQDVMYFQIQRPPVTQLSDCDIKAWEAAMAWIFAGTVPALPTATSVLCGTGGPGPGPGPGGTLVVTSLTTDKTDYVNRERILITATVTDGDDPVEDAVVQIRIVMPNKTFGCSPTTNSSGEARCRHKINANRDGEGTYTITAQAFKSGFDDSAIVETTVNVSK